MSTERRLSGLSPYAPDGVRDTWEVRTQRLQVTHVTTYRYENPVLRSSHLLRLRPESGVLQNLEQYDLSISVDASKRDFEDVFGNRTTLLDVSAPFQEMRIESRSVVRVGGRGQDDPYLEHDRPSLPLVWMPWEHQVLFPYLLPPELPAFQLQELTEYARTFSVRNGSDLFWTLRDICQTLKREYSYTPYSTDLETTPYEVYQTRQGVCQDFANLFICLARLNHVPARYRVGYLYTGGRYENEVQSEASHAWAEVYLPWVGWTGFDPTNGILTDLDHVRVARGRNYRDATPTSGIIYEGGGAESLEVDVKVVQLSS
ncbi:MAG: transglutaminase family protein [Longimicrobiales bacterium]|nr:transglutaminase family protein [Longimicrobiales bacterium]